MCGEQRWYTSRRGPGLDRYIGMIVLSGASVVGDPARFLRLDSHNVFLRDKRIGTRGASHDMITRYCTLPSAKKPLAVLDVGPLLSPGHASMADSCTEPATAAATAARQGGDDGGRPQRVTKQMKAYWAVCQLGLRTVRRERGSFLRRIGS